MRGLALSAAVSLAACGGPSTDLEGIYTVDTWARNDQACTPPGTDELSIHEPLVFISLDSFFGQDVLDVVECADQTDCTTQANDDTIDLGTFLFEKGGDKDGWTGTISFAGGPDPNGDCTGSVENQTLTRDGDTAVQVRAETIDAGTFAPRGGECNTDDAVAAAMGQPCTSLELMHATFTTAF